MGGSNASPSDISQTLFIYVYLQIKGPSFLTKVSEPIPGRELPSYLGFGRKTPMTSESFSSLAAPVRSRQ
jgi:hypothetical protein